VVRGFDALSVDVQYRTISGDYGMTQTVTLRQHFAKLFDFSGREDRASFWPYAALAFGIIMIAGMLIFIPTTMGAIQAMQQFAVEHPEQVTTVSGPGQYSISVQGDHPAFMPVGSIVLYLVVTFGLAILLYAAAVVRRLRDSGKSGAWGLIPLPFILYSSVQMSRVFAMIGTGGRPDMTLFMSIFVSNLLYIVSLLGLIVLLAWRSEPEPNRFSETL